MLRQVLRTVLLAGLLPMVVPSLFVHAGDAAYPERHWDFAGWHGGGAFTNIVYTDMHRILLASDVAGVWVSDDDGLTWEQANAGIADLRISTLGAAPSDRRVVYAGSESGVFRSIDGGIHWTACDTAGDTIRFRRPDNYRSLAVSPHDSSLLAAGTADGRIFLSPDAGANWRLLGGIPGVNVPVAVTAVFFNDTADTLYAALGRTLYVYSLRGSVWRVCHTVKGTITDAGRYEADGNSFIYFVAGRRIHLSDDGGDTWRRTRKIPRGQAWRMTMLSREDLLVAWKDGWQGGLFRSSDAGKSWREIKRFDYDTIRNPTRIWKRGNERVFALAVAPSGNRLMMTTDWGVFYSDDQGDTWDERINGAANTVGSDISISDDGTIFAAAMDNGLLVSTDGGSTYRCAFPQQGYSPERNGHVWRVAVSPDDQDHVIATSSPWSQRVNQVIVSSDGGRSFTVVRSGLPGKRPHINTVWKEGYARALAIDPQRPDMVYLGIDGDDGGGLYVSRDRGFNWESSPIQPPSCRIYNGLAVDPTIPDRVYWGACGNGGGLFISERRDRPWTRAPLKVRNVFDIAVDAEGTVYVAGEHEGPVVYRSDDSGKSWKMLARFPGTGAAEAIWIHPDDSSLICASTVLWHGYAGGRIWMSRDRGESWFDISGDISPGSGAAAISYSRPEEMIYLIRYNGSVFKSQLR